MKRHKHSRERRRTPHIILIDNYDSFVYNIYQYLCQLGARVDVVRNDEISIGSLKKYDGIVISPGPGRPEEAGLSPSVVERYAGARPILGVCLGHQIIGYIFGAEIVNAKRIMHGKISEIEHDQMGLFKDIPNPTSVVRYHSLVIRDVPKDFKLTARAEDGDIMGIRNERLKIEGIQFHPESVMTTHGLKMMKNFLDLYVISGE